MTRNLNMVFLNQSGKNTSINIADINDTVTPEQIRNLMQLIISKNIFESTGGDLVSAISADIITRSVEEISVR